MILAMVETTAPPRNNKPKPAVSNKISVVNSRDLATWPFSFASRKRLESPLQYVLTTFTLSHISP